MIREVYYVLNFVLHLLIVFTVFSIQSVLLKLPWLSWTSLDLVLLIVVYFGLQRSLITGTVVTLVVSHCAELHSGAPTGLVMSCYLIVYAGTVITREFFLMEGGFSTLLLGVFAGAVWKISFVLLMAAIGRLENIIQPVLLYLIPFLMSQALLSRFMLNFLKKVDVWTKVKEASQLA